MTLRVTRQYVEVLGPGNGTARVTRQYVDVLGSAVFQVGHATDTLTLTQVAGLVTWCASADALTLTQSATRVAVLRTSGRSTLQLTDVAVAVASKHVHHVIALADVAEATVIWPVEDVLSLSDQADVLLVWDTHGADVLNLQAVAAVQCVYARATGDILSLTETVLADLCKVGEDALTLADEALVELVKVVGDSLTLTDQADQNIVKSLRVAHHLALAGTAGGYRAFTRGVSSALGLNDVATATAAKLIVDTLDLSDVADCEKVITVQDTLALQQQVEVLLTGHRRLTATILLVDQAVAVRHVTRSAISTLILHDAADGTPVHAVVDQVQLVQTARAKKAVSVAASNVLTLLQQALVRSNQVAAQDTLGLSDGVGLGFSRLFAVWSAMALRDRAVGHNTSVRVAASDVLATIETDYDPVSGAMVESIVGLQDSAAAAVIYAAPFTASHLLSFGERAIGIVIRADAIAAEATDTLTLMDAAARNVTLASASALTLTHTAVAVVTKVVASVLVLIHQASVVGVYGRVAVNSMNLGQAVNFIHLGSLDWTGQYHPFVGTGLSGAPTPPASTLTYSAATPAESTFLYPATSPTDTLLMRNPEFGNKDRLEFNRISRETRGGTLVVYADSIWPKVQVLVLTFSGLTQIQGRGLLTFMAAHLGEEIGYVDWERRLWKGVITNPNDALVQDARGVYTASVEFEGALA